MDTFGINKIYPTISNGREWFCNWNEGDERTYTFGPAGSSDPGLIFRGNGNYTINAGTMKVYGSCPRIYVRGSSLETDKLPNVPKWDNVEITFYANTVDVGQNVSYAGIEAVVRTNHYPDNLLCSTRGYGCKINFDGRCQFEKECVHDGGNKQTSSVFAFNGRMPLNTWIGMKYICRSCDNGTKCKLEMYLDMTDGKNGGTWNKVTEFTDYDTWSSDKVSCCELHKGKVLLPPHMNENYSVYLRTDGNAIQYYKKFSIRSIKALP